MLTGMVRLFGSHGTGSTYILRCMDDSEWNFYWKVWHVCMCELWLQVLRQKNSMHPA